MQILTVTRLELTYPSYPNYLGREEIFCDSATFEPLLGGYNFLWSPNLSYFILGSPRLRGGDPFFGSCFTRQENGVRDRDVFTWRHEVF